MIETDRLVLRPAVDADRDAIADLNARPEVGAWLGGVRTRAESDAFVDRVMAHQTEHGFGFWGVDRKADGRLIGMTGVWWAPPEMNMPGVAEIGWRFLPEALGPGLRHRSGEGCARLWLPGSQAARDHRLHGAHQSGVPGRDAPDRHVVGAGPGLSAPQVVAGRSVATARRLRRAPLKPPVAALANSRETEGPHPGVKFIRQAKAD